MSDEKAWSVKASGLFCFWGTGIIWVFYDCGNVTVSLLQGVVKT